MNSDSIQNSKCYKTTLRWALLSKIQYMHITYSLYHITIIINSLFRHSQAVFLSCSQFHLW